MTRWVRQKHPSSPTTGHTRDASIRRQQAPSNSEAWTHSRSRRWKGGSVTDSFPDVHSVQTAPGPSSSADASTCSETCHLGRLRARSQLFFHNSMCPSSLFYSIITCYRGRAFSWAEKGKSSLWQVDVYILVGRISHMDWEASILPHCQCI